MLRIALVFALVAGASVRIADACPAGSPCLKYRRPPPAPARVWGYQRITAVTMPRLSRANVIALLTSSDWDPLWAPIAAQPNANVVAPPRVRFREARNVNRNPLPMNMRTVIVREVEFHDGKAMVGVDGEVFQLGRCDDSRRHVCLTRLDGVTFEQLNAPVSPDSHFAQPPQ
ncbi:MAG TPA: hypothetical protein VL326_30370 [Kofleriaceae bacterium]|jgi:hypothetical protein|nr:hypothetical protein [Kofleriaceae bacterium]